MTSVGPPAGNPTTTRTDRFGYPCADEGATPVSNSNRLARIPYKTAIVAFPPENFLGAIIGEGAVANKGKTSPADAAGNDGRGQPGQRGSSTALPGRKPAGYDLMAK